MENQNTCDLCGKEEKLYYCECGKFFCRYHDHLILHKCPVQYPIKYRIDRIMNKNKCYVCTKKHQEYLDVIVKEVFAKSIDILKIIIVLLITDL